MILDMKAAYYYSNNDIRIKDIEIPDISDDELLIQNKYCGICVADTMEWYLKDRVPLITGHEAVGVVSKIGKNVSKFNVGDRVFVHHHVPCLRCDYCRDGKFTMCDDFRRSNYRPGGFAEYFVIGKNHIECDTLLLPEKVSFKEATLIEPLACVLHAINISNVKPNHKVCIIGAGTMGLLFIQALMTYGIYDVITYETISWRQKQAKSFGSKAVFSPSGKLSIEKERVMDIFGVEGYDKIFVVAKDLKAMEMALNLTRRGASVLLFASPQPAEFLRINVSEAFFKELTVNLSYSANHSDTRQALYLIENEKINTKQLITNVYKLEELATGIRQTAGRGESLKCIVEFD